jgi:tetratricopeptide (TPR) repeat protein
MVASGDRRADRPWRARILVGGTDICCTKGAGTLILPDQVLTAAHVLVDKQSWESLPREPPDVEVHLRFDWSSDKHVGRVSEILTWMPDLDIAVLRLANRPDPEIPTVRLLTADPKISARRMSVWGFPATAPDEDAIPVELIAVDQPSSRGRLTFRRISPEGPEVQEGFSGAGVYDPDLDGVVAVVLDLLDTHDNSTCSAISCDRLVEHIDGLSIVDAGRLLAARNLAEHTIVAPTRDGLPPYPRDLPPDLLGVYNSEHQDGDRNRYIRRPELDAKLRESAAKGAVIAHGPRWSGKSRSLYELLQGHYPGSRVVVPRKTDGSLEPLARALAAVRSFEPGEEFVVWLDHLEDFEHNDLLQALPQMREAKATILATLTGSPSCGLSRMTGRYGGKLVNFSIPLSRDEIATAERHYENGDFRSSATIGTWFLGGDHLLEKYHRLRRQPGLKLRIVQAAAAWWRMGMTAPVSPQQLNRVLQEWFGEEVDPDRLDAALEDLAREAPEQGGDPPLLGFRGYGQDNKTPQYLAPRALAEHLRPGATCGQECGQELPSAVWDLALGGDLELDGSAYVRIADFAEQENAQDARERALSRAQRGTDSVASAWASLLAADSAVTAGRWPEAREHLDRVLDSGVEHLHDRARIELGQLAIKEGKWQEALELLEKAVENADPSISDVAKAYLVEPLLRAGRFEEATRLAKEAAQSDVGDAAALVTARRAREKSADKPNAPDVVDGGAPAEALQRIRRHRLRAVQQASLAVGVLALTGKGDVDQARAEWNRVAEMATDGDLVAQAMLSLAELDVLDGDLDRAERTFTEFLGHRHAEWPLRARIGLAKIASARDDTMGALRELRSVRDTGHPVHSPAAGYLMAETYAAGGEFSEAEEAYRWVIGEPNPDAAAAARVDLALLYQANRRVAQAESLLREVAASGDHDQGPRAVDLLGDLLKARGDRKGARAAYERAVDSQHPLWSPMAVADLAQLCHDEGDDDAAREHLNRAIRVDHPVIAGRARILYAEIEADRDPSAAVEHLEEAYRSSNVVVSLSAAFALVLVWGVTGQAAEAESYARNLLTELRRFLPEAQKDLAAVPPHPGVGWQVVRLVDVLESQQSPDQMQAIQALALVLYAWVTECGLSLSPSASAAAQARLGRLMAQIGDAEKEADTVAEGERRLRQAIDDFDRLPRVGDPDRPEDSLARLWLVSVLVKNGGDPDEMRDLLDPVLDDRPAALYATASLRAAQIELAAAADPWAGEFADDARHNARQLLRDAIVATQERADAATADEAARLLATLPAPDSAGEAGADESALQGRTPPPVPQQPAGLLLALGRLDPSETGEDLAAAYLVLVRRAGEAAGRADEGGVARRADLELARLRLEAGDAVTCRLLLTRLRDSAVGSPLDDEAHELMVEVDQLLQLPPECLAPRAFDDADCERA